MTAIQLVLKHDPACDVLVVVPTKNLKDQWIEQLISYGIIGNCRVEVINTTIKRKQRCNMLIIDEIHLVGATTFAEIFHQVDYDLILGLTATMERLDGKEEIIKKYAPICDTITLDEAIKNGWVSPIKNYLVLLKVDLSEYQALNRTFNSYFSYFNFDFAVGMKCMQDWKFRASYARQIGTTAKQVMAMAAGWMKALHARNAFISTHPAKIEACRKILDARKDTKCITFCPTIKFAESIKRGVTLHSGKKDKENKQAIEDFNKAEKGVVLNSSKALTQGTDLQGLTVGVRMNVNSSKITSTQQQGRCCRFAPGKVAEMFTIVIADTQEVKWFANSAPKEYIVLDTPEKLEAVLRHEEVKSRPREFTKDLNYRF